MTHRVSTRLLAIVAGIMLVAAACNGGDDDTEAQAEGEADIEAEAGDGFGALVQQAEQATVRVTYRTDTGEEITFSQDPPESAIIAEGAHMITSGESFIFCSSEADEGCFEFEGLAQGEAFAGNFIAGIAAPFFAFQQLGAGQLGDVDTSEREIAGRAAQCATVDADAGVPGVTLEGSATYCVDVETGALLLAETTSGEGETTTFEAIEVGEPEPGDFEPASPPQNFGDLPGGGAVPTAPQD